MNTPYQQGTKYYIRGPSSWSKLTIFLTTTVGNWIVFKFLDLPQSNTERIRTEMRQLMQEQALQLKEHEVKVDKALNEVQVNLSKDLLSVIKEQVQQGQQLLEVKKEHAKSRELLADQGRQLVEVKAEIKTGLEKQKEYMEGLFAELCDAINKKKGWFK